MFFFEKIKGLIILVVLLIISTADASLTLDVYKDRTAFFSSYDTPDLGLYSKYQQEKQQYIGLCIYQSSGVASELNRVFVNYEQPLGSVLSSKSLPAGPGALLMVVASFICISLVRDRRFWIKALIGLLWAGQAGLNILPDVISRLSGHKDEVFFYCDYSGYYRPVNNRCFADNIEDTKYIGLLRFLAGIPESEISIPLPRSFLKNLDDREKLGSSCRYAYHKPTTRNNLTSIRIVIIGFLSFFEHSIQYLRYYCLALISEWYVYLSGSFGFVQLARGPPRMYVRL